MFKSLLSRRYFRRNASHRNKAVWRHFEILEGRQLLATFYVDSIAGNDGNNGTAPEQAWLTLSKVESKVLAAGDAVLFRRGSSWNDSLDVVRSGDSGQPITYGAYGTGEAPILFRLTIAGNNLVFEDLIIDHQKQDQDAVRVRNSRNVTLRGLQVRNGASDGIDVDLSDGLLIEGSHIHHFLAGSFTEQFDAHGVVVTRTNGVTIRDTVIHHVSGDSFQADPNRGIPLTTDILIERSHFWTSPLDADFNQWLAGQRPGENAIDTKVADTNIDAAPRMKITVRDLVAHGWRKDGFINNKAVFNMKEKIDATFDRVTVYDSEIAFRLRGTLGNADVLIQNTLVYDVEKAIRAEDNLANLRVFNSTFADGIGSQIQFAGGNGGIGSWDFRNNAYVGAKPSIATDSSNRLATAADFVNAANRDYHLATTSALIDAGTTIALVTTDRDSVVRPQGAGYDIGAFEREIESRELDIVMQSLQASGDSMSLTYEVIGSAAVPFEVKFYRSSSNLYTRSSVELGTALIQDADSLSIGIHTQSFSIGRGGIALPGAGAAENNSDYFILAVADPQDLLEETDAAGINEDNVVALTGVYHILRGPVHVHGGSSADNIFVTSPLNISFNGSNYSFVSSDVSSVRIRSHDGNDFIDASLLDKPLFARGGSGHDSIQGGTAADSLFGDLGNDVLHGGSENDRIFGGQGADSLDGGEGNDWLEGNAGNDVQVGGSGNDRFVFDADSALGVDRLDEIGGGLDWLDFSSTKNKQIDLDLSLSAAQRVNANLTLTLVSDFENVLGGQKDDALAGNRLSNILVGLGGSDTLRGDMGGDLLIGGDGRDDLDGGDGDDLLVAGVTNYDTNQTDLSKILSVWVMSAIDYETRVSRLRGGQGVPPLTARLTVLNDAIAGDQLRGAMDRDWFFATLEEPLDRFGDEELDLL